MLNLMICFRGSTPWRFVLPLLALLLSKQVVEADSLRKLIVGGSVAPPKRFPYYVGFSFPGSASFNCGGLLIARDVVLTSADCFEGSPVNPGSWTVWVNRTTSTTLTGFEYRRVPEKIVIHPNYALSATEVPLWDFALVKLKAEVAGIQSPSLNGNAAVPSAGQTVSVIGLGSTSAATDVYPANLQVADMNVVATDACRTNYATTNDPVNPANMLCAGNANQDACFGDGGSPLIVKGNSAANDVAVGLVSWGPLEGCGVAGFPGVYARISGAKSWIETNTCSLSKASVKPSFCSTGGGGSGFVCFSQETYVTVKDRGDISMKDLQLGDEVLVGNNNYEPVYSFGHRSVDVSGQYLKFSPSNLELSADHMVFVQGKGAIPASSVMIGDELVGGQVVTSIRKVTSKGAYAPFTPSGTIVVNGVQASSFVSFQNSAELMLGSVSTGLKYQWLAHLFELPHRVWCYHIGACLEEQYTENGVSMWVNRPHKMAQWFISLGVFGKILMLVPLVLISLILSLVQLVFLYPGGLGAIAAAIFVAVMISFKIHVKIARTHVAK